MTGATDLLARLRALGFEVEPDPPAVVVRYLRGAEPPPEALPILDELRTHKGEILAELEAAPALQPADPRPSQSELPPQSVELSEDEIRIVEYVAEHDRCRSGDVWDAVLPDWGHKAVLALLGGLCERGVLVDYGPDGCPHAYSVSGSCAKREEAPA